MADTSAERLRAEMQARIDELLPAAPGLLIKSKVSSLARMIGLPAGRLAKYRRGDVNRPAADEYFKVMTYGERFAEAQKRIADMDRSIKGTLHAYDEKRANLPGAHLARNARYAAEQGPDQAGAPDLSAGLARFATRILECAAIPVEVATEQHRSLLRAIAETSGEFTDGVATEMQSSGLDRRTWLYLDDPAFPVRHVGADIPIVSAEDRDRIMFRPLREQPLAPTFLSTILDQFNEVKRHSRPTLHRITATFGGRPITYDRLTNHFPMSNLFMSCCLPVGAQ